MCDISVIVPIYNVEEYLAECLDSLLRQGDVALQVILVDDGSPDGSGEIAKAYADKYDWFEYHRIPNGGVGHARNYGITLARGKYLAFVDSDDALADKTYEKMFRRAEQDGSDLTICHVDRFNSEKHWNASLQDMAFEKMMSVTHVRDNPRLLHDTTVWNKLILRSFYLEHGFAFPEGLLYEDIPVSIQMHYRANQVSLLFNVGYHWRVREGATKSITQNTDHLRNLMDRVAILRLMDRFFKEAVKEPELYMAYQVQKVEIDLLIFIRKCKELPRETAAQYLSIINEYIDEAIDEHAFEALRAVDRQKYRLVRNKDLDGLLTFLSYDQYKAAPVTERDGGLYADLPGDLFPITEANITEEMARIHPLATADSIALDEKGLSMNLFLYRDRYNIASESDQRVKAWLFDEVTGEKIPMEQAFFDSHKLTEESGTITEAKRGISKEYCYDGTGVTLRIQWEDAGRLFAADGEYNILIEMESRLFKDRFLLAPDGAAFQSAVGKTVVCGDTSVTIEKGMPKTFLLAVDHQPAVSESIFCAEDGLHFVMNRPVDGLYALDKDGGIAARAEKVLEAPGTPGVTSDGATVAETEYRFCTSAPFDMPVEVFADCPTDRGAVRKRVLARGKLFDVLPTADGFVFVANTCGVRFILRQKAALVDQVRRTEDRIVISARLGAGLPGGFEKALLKMEAPLEGKEIQLASAGITEKENEDRRCSFTIKFMNEKILKNLYAGRRYLFLDLVGKDGGLTRVVPYGVVSCNKTLQAPGQTIVLKRAWLGELFLQIKNDWPKEESSGRKRKRLIVEKLPAFREEEIRPRTILFETAQGSEFGGRPREVYEYIIKHFPDYQCVWSLKDAKTPITGPAERIRTGSVDYYHHLATARYLVTDEELPDLYVKRDDQVQIRILEETPDGRKTITKENRGTSLSVQGYDGESIARKLILTPAERVKAVFKRD